MIENNLDNLKRDDITIKNVFISWTGKDETGKDKIKTALRENGISCTDSTKTCHVNFEQ